MVEKQVNTHIEKKKKNEWFKWMNGEKNILDQKKKKSMIIPLIKFLSSTDKNLWMAGQKWLPPSE